VSRSAGPRSGTAWRAMALLGGDDEIQFLLNINKLSSFSSEPPKLGVARSNRARVTILSFVASKTCAMSIVQTRLRATSAGPAHPAQALNNCIGIIHLQRLTPSFR
jgi:hypothetical protein